MKKKVGTNNKIESVFVSAHIWLTASYMHTYTAPPRNIYMNVYTFWAPERDECYYTFFRATYFHFHFLHRKKIARCKNGKKRLLMREHFCDIYINDDFSLGKLYESLHRFINKCVLNCRKMPFPPHSSHTMASTRRKKKKNRNIHQLKLSSSNPKWYFHILQWITQSVNHFNIRRRLLWPQSTIHAVKAYRAHQKQYHFASPPARHHTFHVPFR